MTNGQGKSDKCVVPTKQSNKAGPSAAEIVEGRHLAKGNTNQQNVARTQCRIHTQSALERVRRAARRDRKGKFTALFHHVTPALLRDAFDSLEKKAAPGIDGVTWQQYEADLESNLEELHARLHRGAYRAKPTRRVYIPKADGRQRPIGITSLEDKLVQRAVVRVPNAVYETDFLGFSYGFRPGRSQHQALDALVAGIYTKKVNWVLDTDIRGFFDAIDHEWLMKFVEHRIGDRRILRLIRKWLSAGVMESDKWTESKEGTPQGGSASPLLANIFLHYALDLWVQQWRKRRARGEVIIVRYADDAVMGFQYPSDAEQFERDLHERLGKFSLELNTDKTRLIEFGAFAASRRRARGVGKPETFDFLGFTHICGTARNGKFLLHRRTSRRRMQSRLRETKVELRRRMHLPLVAQGAWLGQVARGYFQYHAVPTNVQTLRSFRKRLEWLWLRTLRRRSQRSRIGWARIRELSQRWIPRAAILHPWPLARYGVRTRGKSPVR